MNPKPHKRGNAEMNKNRLLLLAALMLAFVPALFAQDDNRISATWQVQRYDITGTLPQSDSDRNLTAKARLEVKNVSSRPASSLTLRISPSAEIISVSVNGSNVDFTKAEEKIASGSLQRFAIRMPAVQPGGTVTAVVDYKLNVKENSGLSAISPAGSQFLPLSFWYPTPNSWFFARGADYAPFRIQITAPGLTVLSSGSENAGSFDSRSGGQPFFVAGNWDVINTHGMTVHSPKGSGADEQKRATELADLAAQARTFMSNMLGPAPDAPLRLVSVKRGGGFASGGTVLVDDGVFRRSKIDSQTAMTIADSVAKKWLGGSVGITGDGSGVIREGLTKYLATQFLESVYGKEIADIERMRHRVAYAAVSRRDAPLSMVSPLDDYYYAVVTNKGAMVWRLLAKKVGTDAFTAALRSAMQDGTISLGELRSGFASEKEFLDHVFDEVTDTNLQAGLPQVAGSETKVALRNTGSVDATVEISAKMANGQVMTAPATVRAKSFGEVIFKTTNKINRVEIDADKLYPQTDYSDDVAPREFTDSDLLLAVKRYFDKQDYANAEKSARTVLSEIPRFDDVRVLLARSLLAQGKSAGAEKEFRAVLEEKLPSSRSIAWANVGLGEIALKAGQAAQAVQFAKLAIEADAEYGSSLAARTLRNKANTSSAVDDGIKAFFAQFDRAAVSNRKADLETLVVPGEVGKFAAGIAGQTQEWTTRVLHADQLDANTVLVETGMSIRLLNRETEAGMAVYRLARTGNGWKLAAVDIFEVR